ncbi:MAG: YtxH domain-containing protein [Chloroflexi bacterium]|nr:YtxH domain-containing protein [Chloroflexota bacterium]
MQRTFSFIAGAFCGAVVGSVVALLLAPMSGRELQTMGRAKTDEAFAEIRRTYDEREAALRAQLAALTAPKTTAPTE